MTTTTTAPSTTTNTTTKPTTLPAPPPMKASKNPLAHQDPKVRLLNSALLLGFVHIGLFLYGNENATPLKLIGSFTLMMALLGAIAFWRARRAAAPQGAGQDFPGAAP